MTTGQSDSARADRLWHEAGEWYFDNQSEPPQSAATLRHWRRWVSDPENGAKYDEFARLYAAIRAVPPPPPPTDAEVREAACESSGLRRYLSLLAHGDGPVEGLHGLWREWSRPVIFAATVAAVACALLLINTARHPASSDSPMTFEYLYEAAPGEHRQFALRDGSVVTLVGATSVKFSFSTRERSVNLERGTAIFEVSHDATRPFRVHAGVGETTAVGTEFYVQRTSDQVVVKVVEGTVAVAPLDPTLKLGWTSTFRPFYRQPSPITVTHGEEMSYDTRGDVSNVHPTDTTAVTALVDSPLEYRGRALREVIQDLQHYTSRRLEIDPAAGQFRFQGRIGRQNIQHWVRGLNKLFPVEIIDSDPDRLIIRATPEPAPRGAMTKTAPPNVVIRDL
jgi:transmembrane sensor